MKQYNCNFFVFTHKGNKALYERQYPESRDLFCTILSEKQKLIHASTFLLKNGLSAHACKELVSSNSWSWLQEIKT